MKKPNHFLKSGLIGAIVCGISISSPAQADAQWWPFDAQDWTSGSPVAVEYTPTEKTTKKWRICAIYPHVKDSFWVAINYGQTSEARRQGAELTVFEAGGYTNVNKQVSQFDDCVALNPDAILVSAISEAALRNKIDQQTANGRIVVSVVNPIFKSNVTAKVNSDEELLGFAGGKMVAARFNGQKARVVQFPGPQGSGFAEASAKGFRDAIAGTDIEILEEKYGDLGKSVQLRLVEDALQAYDDIDILFGAGVMAEVAVGAVADAGLSDDSHIFAWYSNQGMIDGVRAGTIAGTITQYPVTLGRIGIDTAIRALENRDFYKEVRPVPLAITKDNIETVDLARAFAEKGYRPTFTVE
jgi:protein TorT